MALRSRDDLKPGSGEPGYSAVAKLESAWVLQGLAALDEGTLLSMLKATDEHLLEAAIALAEVRMDEAGASLETKNSGLSSAVGRALENSSTRVRFQASLTLGGLTPFT